MKTEEQVRVVIVGGGFGGLETALYVRQRLGDRATVTLISDRENFLFKPYLTYIPFGLMPEVLKIDLGNIARTNHFVFYQGRVQRLDPDRKEIRIDGLALPYDFLILATGVAIAPEEIAGLYEYAHMVWRTATMVCLRAALQQLLADVEAGRRRRVVFLVPPGCQWAGPLYEMACMLETWLRGKGARSGVDMVVLTAESAYMQVFGPRMHKVIEEELDRRHIEAYTAHYVERVEPDSLISQDGERLPYDLLIASPTYVASTLWNELPVDERGFLRTEPATRQVVNHPDIYAVGDASDYPIKQAFLALLQADAAAEHLAACVLQTEPAFRFDPKGLWLMEQLDQAVFAEVPLNERGEVESLDTEDSTYEVDQLPAGQLQRMLVSAHLPRHLRHFGANPLYAGLFWKGTKVGLKVLSHLAGSVS